jgi:hypothetical protein
MNLLGTYGDKSHAVEVFTLVEGRVTINYPAKVSGESIGDMEQYFKLFVAKLARQGEDPHDPMQPQKIE